MRVVKPIEIYTVFQFNSSLNGEASCKTAMGDRAIATETTKLTRK